jgi:hypothetical protein
MTDKLRTALDLTLTNEEVGGLAAFLDDDLERDDAVRLLIGDGHSGYGLYASHPEYPDEGAIIIKNLPEPTGANVTMTADKQALRAQILTQIDHCAQLAYAAGHHFAKHGKHAPSSIMTKADADAKLIRLIEEYAAHGVGVGQPQQDRIGPEGWRKLAESLVALGQTDERIKELTEKYGLGPAGVKGTP